MKLFEHPSKAYKLNQLMQHQISSETQEIIAIEINPQEEQKLSTEQEKVRESAELLRRF